MISVIIPTLNAAESIGPCLGALSPAVFGGALADVVIVDGGSKDDIAEIADATGARFLTVGPGRGAQLAAGAAAARGDWLLFLHADTILGDGWLDAARAHMATGGGKAAYFRLAFDAPGLAPAFVAGWANLRAKVFGLPFGDQGLLIHRGLYRAVGGHQALPLMEDVALARALGRGRLAPLAANAVTDAARYRRNGWVRQGAGNLWRQARFLAGARAETLAPSYRDK